MTYYSYIYYFFFFQAEDGIRDKLVTGVQTCALPISAKRAEIPPVSEVPTRNRSNKHNHGLSGRECQQKNYLSMDRKRLGEHRANRRRTATRMFQLPL